MWWLFNGVTGLDWIELCWIVNHIQDVIDWYSVNLSWLRGWNPPFYQCRLLFYKLIWQCVRPTEVLFGHGRTSIILIIIITMLMRSSVALSMLRRPRAIGEYFSVGVPEAFLTWFMAALCWSLFAWSTTQLVLWFIEPLIHALEQFNFSFCMHCTTAYRQQWGYSGPYHTVATYSSGALVRAEPAIFLM